jgi:RNA polymerase sigma factor (sigma-70 family)
MTDQEIVEGLEKNLPQVYAYLYETLYAKVKGYVMQRGGSEQDAEDVFHEVLLKLPKAILTYQEHGKFFRWFFTIVGNTWAEMLRRRKNQVPLSEVFHPVDDSDDELPSLLVKERKYEILYKTLGQLSADCQQILRLFHLDKVDSKDIAAKLGVADGAMRVRLKRCRDRWTADALAMFGQLNL